MSLALSCPFLSAPSLLLSGTPSKPQNLGGSRPPALSVCAEKWSKENEPRGWQKAASGGAALLAAFVLLHPAEPSLAYIGGGPYGREVTRGQDLTGRDFSGLDLTRQDFKTSILRQANFRGAKLLGASFFDADLTGADFSDADLRGVDFSLTSATKANFTNANFEGATVTGNTSFKGSTITGADFTDVPLREDQKKYLCTIASGVNSVTGNETRDTLFCPN